jgi:hypothetical protein
MPQAAEDDSPYFALKESPGPVYVPDRGPPYASDMTKPFLRLRAEQLMDQASRETGAQRAHLTSLIYNGLSRLAGANCK